MTEQLHLFSNVQDEQEIPADPCTQHCDADLPLDQENRNDTTSDCSSEEEKVQAGTIHSISRPARGPGFDEAPIVVSSWPAALTWQRALEYSSLSQAQLRLGVKQGSLRFLRIGANGARVVARAELDALIAKLFGAAPGGIEEDFDFG